ncbi:unnamed protein product [Sphagnum balticum]
MQHNRSLNQKEHTNSLLESVCVELDDANSGKNPLATGQTCCFHMAPLRARDSSASAAASAASNTDAAAEAKQQQQPRRQRKQQRCCCGRKKHTTSNSSF